LLRGICAARVITLCAVIFLKICDYLRFLSAGISEKYCHLRFARHSLRCHWWMCWGEKSFARTGVVFFLADFCFTE
jgi:hypothetical protein